jgi:hypothetical protein
VLAGSARMRCGGGSALLSVSDCEAKWPGCSALTIANSAPVLLPPLLALPPLLPALAGLLASAATTAMSSASAAHCRGARRASGAGSSAGAVGNGSALPARTRNAHGDATILLKSAACGMLCTFGVA